MGGGKGEVVPFPPAASRITTLLPRGALWAPRFGGAHLFGGDMQLSEHFGLEELTVSDYAVRHRIDNDPIRDPLLMRALADVLAPGLERVRALLGVPMLILSGYRCPALNRAIGGHPNSFHVRGLAADFVAPRFGSPADVAGAIAERAGAIDFDQLILEFPARGGWVHIGFAEPGTQPRFDLLTANAKGRYSRGIQA